MNIILSPFRFTSLTQVDEALKYRSWTAATERFLFGKTWSHLELSRLIMSMATYSSRTGERCQESSALTWTER